MYLGRGNWNGGRVAVEGYVVDFPTMGAVLDMGALSPELREFAEEIVITDMAARDLDLLFVECREAFLTYPGMDPERLDAFREGYRAAMRKGYETVRSALGDVRLSPAARHLVYGTDFGLTAAHDVAEVTSRRAGEIRYRLRAGDATVAEVLTACKAWGDVRSVPAQDEPVPAPAEVAASQERPAPAPEAAATVAEPAPPGRSREPSRPHASRAPKERIARDSAREPTRPAPPEETASPATPLPVVAPPETASLPSEIVAAPLATPSPADSDVPRTSRRERKADDVTAPTAPVPDVTEGEAASDARVAAPDVRVAAEAPPSPSGTVAREGEGGGVPEGPSREGSSVPAMPAPDAPVPSRRRPPRVRELPSLNGSERKYSDALLGRAPVRKVDAAAIVGTNRGIGIRAIDGLVAKGHARKLADGTFALTKDGEAAARERAEASAGSA